MVLGVVGCSNSVLSDDYDEATLKSSAQKVLEQLNAGEYQAITDSVSLDLQNDLSADVIKQAWIPLYEKLGTFDAISNYIISGKEEYAVVVVLAKYEKGTLQLTLSYNPQMELVGLYMK
nr:DUF3887 domain-containing protein [Turicibacter bilis]